MACSVASSITAIFASTILLSLPTRSLIAMGLRPRALVRIFESRLYRVLAETTGESHFAKIPRCNPSLALRRRIALSEIWVRNETSY